MVYFRYLEEQIGETLEQKKKSVLIYGPRQVGKTTLAKSFIRNEQDAYFTCDDQTIARMFVANNPQLQSIVGPYQRIVIDEAQRIVNAGLVIKLLIDTFPDKEFIVTGSSALELAFGVFDALTGRVRVFSMYPLSLGELSSINPLNPYSLLETYLRFGTYPEVINAQNDQDRQTVITTTATQYLFKDTLNFEMKKQTDFLEKLVALLASQTGSPVSYNSLANALDAGRETIDRYIYLLTKLFIIIPLHPYHNNFKKRITKQSKFFFWDVGIRNAVMHNFGAIDIRSDKGGLWENFIIIERMKYNESRQYLCNYYFFKAENGHEIDLIEETDGTITCFEIKYAATVVSRGVENAAKELGKEKSEIIVIHKENYLSFIR